MSHLADYRGKAGDAAKGEVAGEFEKVNPHYHNPDADRDRSLLGDCVPEWIFDFFHNERIPSLIILYFRYQNDVWIQPYNKHVLPQAQPPFFLKEVQ